MKLSEFFGKKKTRYGDDLKDTIEKLLHAIDSIDTEECEKLIEEIG